MLRKRWADHQEAGSLATVLEVLRRRWPQGFQASEVAEYAGRAEPDAIAFRDALEHAAGKPLKLVSSTTVAWRLKALTDAPVMIRENVFAMKYKPDPGRHGGIFCVDRVGT
jgi:hypothetical protein